jgi:hypothetical protein
MLRQAKFLPAFFMQAGDELLPEKFIIEVHTILLPHSRPGL